MEKIKQYFANRKKRKQKSNVFAFMQRLGKSFMLPISVLPIAGLLLGIGSAFTNYQEIYYNQNFGVNGPFSTMGTILNFMKASGEFLFANMPLLFAVAIPLGLAKKNKGIAAFTGFMSFLIMHATFSSILALQGKNSTSTAPDYLMAHGESFENATRIFNQYESVLGLWSIRMSVFGGLVAGFMAYGTFLWMGRIKPKNEWTNAFFGDYKMSIAVVIPVVMVLSPLIFYVWQVFFILLGYMSTAVEKTSYFGTFLFGYIERALMPFGVHHTFYIPFWQTSLGGSLEVAGQQVQGAQNIFFAQLQDPDLKHFSVLNGSRFWGGRFIFDMFGIPAAAIALFFTLPKGKRRINGSLLFSGAATAFLTGITEPFEFLFVFVAPLLFWGPYCILAGLAHLAIQVADIGVGQVFSGGIIEYILFGVIQGNAKTSWINILYVGPIFSVLYASLMYFYVKKFEVNLFGRLDDLNEIERKNLASFKWTRKKGIAHA